MVPEQYFVAVVALKKKKKKNSYESLHSGSAPQPMATRYRSIFLRNSFPLCSSISSRI